MIPQVQDHDSEIWNFYNHDAPIPRGDCRGHTLENILALDPSVQADWQILESRHNFIQWLFPTQEPSIAQPGSPFYHRPIQVNAEMQGKMLRSLDLMKRFYHVRPNGHNCLRITRIINSLKLHGLQPQAQEFCRWIVTQHPHLNAHSQTIWHRAAGLSPAPQPPTPAPAPTAAPQNASDTISWWRWILAAIQRIFCCCCCCSTSIR